MPSRARRIVIPQPSIARVEDFLLPDPGAEEIVIATEYSLISTGTELALYTGTNEMSGSASTYPFHSGYAAVGTVAEVGSAVRDYRIGERIFAQTPHASHACFDPRRKICAAIPDDLPGERAVFVRIALITLAALCRADIRAGEWLGVVGLGIVGSLGAQFGRLAGYKVVASGRSTLRDEIARRCGIDNVTSGDAHEVGEAVKELTQGAGCRFVLETSGTPAGLEKTAYVAGPGGTISLVGVPWRNDRSVDLHRITQPLFQRYLTLRSGWEWDLPLYPTIPGVPKPAIPFRHSTYGNAIYAIDAIRSGTVIVDPMITQTFSPDRAQDAYDGLAKRRDRYMGVVIDWRN